MTLQKARHQAAGRISTDASCPGSDSATTTSYLYGLSDSSDNVRAQRRLQAAPGKGAFLTIACTPQLPSTTCVIAEIDADRDERDRPRPRTASLRRHQEMPHLAEGVAQRQVDRGFGVEMSVCALAPELRQVVGIAEAVQHTLVWVSSSG